MLESADAGKGLEMTWAKVPVVQILQHRTEAVDPVEATEPTEATEPVRTDTG